MTKENEGPELDHGAAYDLLFSEVAALVADWTIYQELFGSKATVEVLNRTAGAHFGHYQSVLLKNIILGISRLREESGHRPVLSLVTLVELTKGNLVEVRKAQSNRRGVVTRASEDLKEIRNNLIAHRNRDVASGVTLLPNAETQAIRASIDAIVAFMNTYSQAVRHSECTFDEPSSSAPHALHLAYTTDFVDSECRDGNLKMIRGTRQHARRLQESS